VRDTDGDGWGDTMQIDTDGDGLYDVIEIDANHDGVVEKRIFDRDGDGRGEEAHIDTDGDGRFDTREYDTDEDGTPDRRETDFDGDGVWEDAPLDDGDSDGGGGGSSGGSAGGSGSGDDEPLCVTGVWSLDGESYARSLAIMLERAGLSGATRAPTGSASLRVGERGAATVTYDKLLVGLTADPVDIEVEFSWRATGDFRVEDEATTASFVGTEDPIIVALFYLAGEPFNMSDIDIVEDYFEAPFGPYTVECSDTELVMTPADPAFTQVWTR
jgi:hypothetical protein